MVMGISYLGIRRQIILIFEVNYAYMWTLFWMRGTLPVLRILLSGRSFGMEWNQLYGVKDPIDRPSEFEHDFIARISEWSYGNSI